MARSWPSRSPATGAPRSSASWPWPRVRSTCRRFPWPRVARCLEPRRSDPGHRRRRLADRPRLRRPGGADGGPRGPRLPRVPFGIQPRRRSAGVGGVGRPAEALDTRAGKLLHNPALSNPPVFSRDGRMLAMFGIGARMRLMRFVASAGYRTLERARCEPRATITGTAR